VPRLQVYFAAILGQILGGIAPLGILATALLAAWQDSVRICFTSLPGS